MSIGWHKDYTLARRCLPHMKSIAGTYLIGEAPQEEDQDRNTDLIVLRLAAVRIACRVRDATKYLERYPDEFTIRSGRPYATKTELDKVIEGWGDYIIYGFAAQTETRLRAWLLGDLRVFRRWHSEYLIENFGAEPGELQENGDGSSSFRCYRIADLPDDFVVQRRLADGALVRKPAA